LHRALCRQALLAAEDRRDGERPAAFAIAQRHIVRARVAVLHNLVPAGGMADIIDRDVVMLAPEERHGPIGFAPAEHVAGGGLALPLGHHPMLDAHPFAAIAIGPEGDVAGGEYAWSAGFQILVDQDSAIDPQS